jgi:hypothetical protein
VGPLEVGQADGSREVRPIGADHCTPLRVEVREVSLLLRLIRRQRDHRGPERAHLGQRPHPRGGDHQVRGGDLVDQVRIRRAPSRTRCEALADRVHRHRRERAFDRLGERRILEVGIEIDDGQLGSDAQLGANLFDARRRSVDQRRQPVEPCARIRARIARQSVFDPCQSARVHPADRRCVTLRRNGQRMAGHRLQHVLAIDAHDASARLEERRQQQRWMKGVVHQERIAIGQAIDLAEIAPHGIEEVAEQTPFGLARVEVLARVEGERITSAETERRRAQRAEELDPGF